ncbi:phosphatidylserine decarboxylase family protein [Blattabacterium sp. (Blaberus giganteus)]|uniref:phosphatidylserine decarboxylase family protein n=1 Tax=Blattabacterium sp. (Blaberus giganteus) TaxID=1186051 RepID=UPI00025F6F98|nr:phosphatidylserine decarboxylase family protein [Blattabacterium sp. (Blaberus giganteus)]AFJ90840.1 phosphatidylserine decarboxylase [Blattabacterium sp. (Blaberus giganteus)]
MIHKEGIPFLVYTLVIVLLLAIFSFLLLSRLICIFVSIFLIVFYIFLIFFFRNPKRNFYDIHEKNKEIIISPVDGKIMDVQQIFENEFLKKKHICISIFMSPFNVHVNRYPVSGKVIYVKYHPGKYMIAWLPKSSLHNEHTTIVVETNKGNKILFRQIAGFLARRIILYAKKNSIVKKGNEFGFIKFGSRVDVFLPLNSIIFVKKGEKVIGGKTKISIIPS